MPDVLITGAAGFLGRGIVRSAVAACLDVRTTDLTDAPPADSVDHVPADIFEPRSLRPAAAGAATVIHAAGLAHVFDRVAAAPFKAVNQGGTVNVITAAAEAGTRHFVLVSSVAVYGGSLRAGTDESADCRPQGAYADSKWRAEQCAREIAAAAGMRLTILRLATLYGEGDRGNVARLMRSIDRGRFIWVGDGSNLKSLLHRDDAARACVLALQTPGGGLEVYNVSSAPSALRTVVLGLATALDRRLPTWHIPASLALLSANLLVKVSRGRGSLANLQHTLQKWLADDVYLGDRFERRSGFRTQVELKDGLRRQVASYRGLALEPHQQDKRDHSRNDSAARI